MAKECNSKTCDKSSCEGCSSKGKNMDLMAEANSMSNVKHVDRYCQRQGRRR